MNTRETFAKNLQEAMRQARLDNHDMAEILGTTSTAIQYYTVGKRAPDIEKLVKISAATNWSVDDLLGNTTGITNYKVGFLMKVLLECGCTFHYRRKDIEPTKQGLYVIMPRNFMLDENGAIKKDSQQAILFPDDKILVEFVEAIIKSSIVNDTPIRAALFKLAEPLYLKNPINVQVYEDDKTIQIPEGSILYER